ncbi:hypothetical protein VCHA53O466_140027 [Vibrio chagasii]|nr:hypothetical protein VCHA53O466_140027 [Vibrio chagasii]
MKKTITASIGGTKLVSRHTHANNVSDATETVLFEAADMTGLSGTEAKERIELSVTDKIEL